MLKIGSISFKEKHTQKYPSSSKERPKKEIIFAENFMKIGQSVQDIGPSKHFKMAIFLSTWRPPF